MKKFIGVHFIMVCITYPRIHMYWRQEMRLALVADIIPRDRLKLLRTNFHVVEEDIVPVGNKNSLWKVQPVLNQVKNACEKIERLPGYYSIDEQMIPFCGLCPKGLRQVIKSKPRPTGLKAFIATTSDGLMLDFEVYQGANTPFTDKSLGVGAAVILHLSKSIPPGSCIYFDRYFTSILAVANASRLYKTHCQTAHVHRGQVFDLLQLKLQVADGLTNTPDRPRPEQDPVENMEGLETQDPENVDPNIPAKRYRPANVPSEAKRHDGY